MTLTINGKQKSFDEPLNLLSLFGKLELQSDRRGVALCVNLQVIPQDRWNTTKLRDGDKIEIVIAAPGG